MLVSIDADDATCNNPDFLARVAGMDRVKIRVGNSRCKVEAINDGVAEEDWSFLIVAADDLEPQRPDYASYLRGLLFHHFPDGDGVLHCNDGRVGRTLNTLNILGRRYFDRFSYLYSPHYRSVYVDNEYQEVSERLGRAVYVDEVVIAHRWVELTGRDPLHRRNESQELYTADRNTFNARKAAGFPLSTAATV